MSEESTRMVDDFLRELEKKHEVRRVAGVGLSNLYRTGDKIVFITYSTLLSPRSAPHYFFGISEILTKVLQQHDNAFVIFICGDIKEYFMIEFKKINAIFSRIPTAKDGHWKVHITSNLKLKEYPTMDLRRYQDRLGIFGTPGTPPDDDVVLQDKETLDADRANFLRMIRGGTK